MAQSLGEALLRCFVISGHDLNRNAAMASIWCKNRNAESAREFHPEPLKIRT
jgi:hypothetical protein